MSRYTAIVTIVVTVSLVIAFIAAISRSWDITEEEGAERALGWVCRSLHRKLEKEGPFDIESVVKSKWVGSGVDVLDHEVDDNGYLLDRWGSKIRISWDETKGGYAVALSSNGPDGLLGTNDDIEVIYPDP